MAYHQAAEHGAATSFRVRVWPLGAKATGIEHAVLTANNALTVGSSTADVKEAKQRTAALIASGTCLVDVTAFIDRPLMDAIAHLRYEGWLSPPTAESTVVLIRLGEPFAEPGFPHGFCLRAGVSFDVFEVFERAPWDLYRTVQQGEAHLCVAASPGNAFTRVSPLACAMFSRSEFNAPTSLTPVVTGLSLEGCHSGCRVTLPAALARSAVPAPPLSVWCPASELAPGPPPFGVFKGDTLWDPYAFPHCKTLDPVPSGSGSPTYFCYKLAAGVDVGAAGFGIVFDNLSTDRLMHCSVVCRGRVAFVGCWQIDPHCVMTRPPGVPVPPPGSTEVFEWQLGPAARGLAAPGLASLMQLHCFAIKGRAGFTEFDADVPGADVDVAEALDWVARLAPEGDAEVLWLLEESLAARYCLSRMDDGLRQSLASAIERAVHSPVLWRAATEALSRGARRLSEWAPADAAAPDGICEAST